MFFFFFNDTAPTEISPLSLPDALPIARARSGARPAERSRGRADRDDSDGIRGGQRGPLAGARDSLAARVPARGPRDRKSTRLNSSHSQISYAVFCLKKKTIIAP